MKEHPEVITDTGDRLMPGTQRLCPVPSGGEDWVLFGLRAGAESGAADCITHRVGLSAVIVAGVEEEILAAMFDHGRRLGDIPFPGITSVLVQIAQGEPDRLPVRLVVVYLRHGEIRVVVVAPVVGKLRGQNVAFDRVDVHVKEAVLVESYLEDSV